MTLSDWQSYKLKDFQEAAFRIVGKTMEIALVKTIDDPETEPEPQFNLNLMPAGYSIDDGIKSSIFIGWMDKNVIVQRSKKSRRRVWIRKIMIKHIQVQGLK
jgi:hypothetical protein